MAIIDDRTAGRDYALPNAANKLKDDVVRLRSQIAAADGDVTALLLALDAKAALVHPHVISDVTGLQTALDGKQPVGTFGTLDDLTDVSVTGAANGQVLIKQGASWIPIALQVGNVTNLETLLNGKAGATATTDALALKAPLASPALTGTPTAPTATPGTDTTQVATTAFTAAGLALKAPLASPEFTGVPVAPTPTVGDSTTKIATTAFVAANAATKLDTRRNRIVNGDMRVSQENGTTSGTTNGYYPADQWAQYRVTSAGTLTVAQVASVTPAGSPNRLRGTVTVADASLAAGEYWTLTQNLEGSNVADFRYGSASAKAGVLRFGFKGPAGTYAARIGNSAANRSYVALFTITGGQANTDTVQTIAIPGDVTGTWLTADGVIGMTLEIVLACGSTFRGAAGWQAGLILGTSGVSNGMGTGAAVFELFDVGLKLDPDATGVYGAYEVGEVDAKYYPERYFFRVQAEQDAVVGVGHILTTTTARIAWQNPYRMCKTPTGLFSTATIFTLVTSTGEILSSLAVTGNAVTGILFTGTTVGTKTVGNGAYLIFNTSVASAWFQENARLS